MRILAVLRAARALFILSVFIPFGVFAAIESLRPSKAPTSLQVGNSSRIFNDGSTVTQITKERHCW
jgi:hypothetical protein